MNNLPFVDELPTRKSKPWQLTGWREARKKFLKGKSCGWCGSEEKLVVHHPQARYSLSDEAYESLEGAVALCRRCHLALHKGLVLCEVCKRNYRRSNREMCWHCFKKSLPSKRVWELEYHPYQHPWCGKSFKIKGKDWQEEADPHMCCLDICELDAFACETAKKHWEESDPDD